jgi:hypothetical protein
MQYIRDRIKEGLTITFPVVKKNILKHIQTG